MLWEMGTYKEDVKQNTPMKHIQFHTTKLAIFYAAFPFVLLPLSVICIAGVHVRWTMLFVCCLVMSLISLSLSFFVSTYLSRVIFDGQTLENRFSGFGRGKVDLAIARKSWVPDLFFIILKDDVHHAVARIPRPFWAEDSQLIREILDQIAIHKC